MLWYCIRNKKSRISTKVYFSPNKKKKFESLQTAKKIVKQKLSRASIKIKKIYEGLNLIKNKMKDISDTNIQKVLEEANIPRVQIDLIREIFKASKVKNSKNRRYSENWMLLCLLFQIRFTKKN